MTLVHPRSSVFRLSVVRGDDEGRHWTLSDDEPRLVIGTAADCEARLHDAQVSRRHVAVTIELEGLRVVDLESTNGLFVNGVQVKDALLHGGEEMFIGSTSIQVRLVDASGPRSESTDGRFGRFFGTSTRIRNLFPFFDRVARCDVPVIIGGETGTGKEVLAESIHEASARATGPFIVFDCTAVAPNLMESALFGHERGAFTGAVSYREGVFEAAHGGTILIDEIGDLDIALQSKLLRVIERAEIQRVGSSQWKKVNVRVMCATRRNLTEEIRQGKFRDDLYYRLAVARIDLPPLREREGDIEYLAKVLWVKLCGEGAPLPTELLEEVRSYRWPGNTRELQNFVTHYHAFGDLANAKRLRNERASVPPKPVASAAPHLDSVEALAARFVEHDVTFYDARDSLVADFGRAYLKAALGACEGNVSKASQKYGIARSHLYTLLDKNDMREERRVPAPSRRKRRR